MAKAFAGLLILVVAVAVGGYYNYHRNAHLDDELKNRPYAGLSDADLDALLQAYQGEMKGLEGRLAGYGKDRTRVMDGFAPADLHGKVQAFESFARKNNSWRDVNRQRLGHEVEVEKLEREKNIRAQGLHIEKNRILRRLLTF